MILGQNFQQFRALQMCKIIHKSFAKKPSHHGKNRYHFQAVCLDLEKILLHTSAMMKIIFPTNKNIHGLPTVTWFSTHLSLYLSAKFAFILFFQWLLLAIYQSSANFKVFKGVNLYGKAAFGLSGFLKVKK